MTVGAGAPAAAPAAAGFTGAGAGEGVGAADGCAAGFGTDPSGFGEGLLPLAGAGLAGLFQPLPVGIPLLDPAAALAELPAIDAPGAGITGFTVALVGLPGSPGEHAITANTRASVGSRANFFIGLPQLLAVGT
jgi:hypothetical protein